ncbi:hypothetical protein Lal_00018426 [Lupinus albus]|nr:hypothetical protein Lal_00018426 [Lupinus albus]
MVMHYLFPWRYDPPLCVIIPTKEALSRRGVSLHSSGGTLCSFCNENSESTRHLFYSCSFTYYVWQLIYNWLGITVALPIIPIHHYLNHQGMMEDKNRWKVWSIILLAKICAIWLHRNAIIFNNVCPSTLQILDTAKVNA